MGATTTLDVRPLALALGAEALGVDLADLGDATFEAVRRAFLDHVVLVFHSQDLSPAAQVAFTARFGPVEAHPLRSRRGLPDHPEILVLQNQPGQPGARNDFWHSDISFAERPPALTVLHGIVVPPGKGDTLFCNMVAAYDGLPADMRARLDGLTGLHSAEPLATRSRAAGTDAKPIADVPPPQPHPAVRTHPETGRRALYVNPYFTQGFEGLPESEGRALIEELSAFATRPDNVYRHRWRAGDVVMWDNRAAMHYAVYDYSEDEPRLMHRTTAGGDRPT